jgi:hypothetical protein
MVGFYHCDCTAPYRAAHIVCWVQVVGVVVVGLCLVVVVGVPPVVVDIGGGWCSMLVVGMVGECMGLGVCMGQGGWACGWEKWNFGGDGDSGSTGGIALVVVGWVGNMVVLIGLGF